MKQHMVFADLLKCLFQLLLQLVIVLQSEFQINKFKMYRIKSETEHHIGGSKFLDSDDILHVLECYSWTVTVVA